MIIAILRHKFTPVRADLSLESDVLLLEEFGKLDIQLVGVQVSDRTGDGKTFSGFYDAHDRWVYVGTPIQPDILRNRTGGSSLDFYDTFVGSIYPSQELKELSINKRKAYQALADIQPYTQLLSIYDVSNFSKIVVLKPYSGTGKGKGVYICSLADVEKTILACDIDVDSYIIQQYHDFSDIHKILIEWRVVCSANRIYYIEKKYKQSYNNVIKREFIEMSDVPADVYVHVMKIRQLCRSLYIPQHDIYAQDRGYDMLSKKRILIEINASPGRNYLVKLSPCKASEYFYTLGRHILGFPQ